MLEQLGGASPLSSLMERRISEAQGRRREAGSEGSVEQSRGPMDKHRITRPTRSDERASDREVQGHQGPGRFNSPGKDITTAYEAISSSVRKIQLNKRKFTIFMYFSRVRRTATTPVVPL